MKTNTKTTAAKNDARSLHVAYTGPDGETYGNVRHFEEQPVANAFFSRIKGKGRSPFWADANGNPLKAKPAKASKPAKAKAKAKASKAKAAA